VELQSACGQPSSAGDLPFGDESNLAHTIRVYQHFLPPKYFVVYAILDYWSWQKNLNYRLANFVHTNEQEKFNLDDAIGAALNSTPVFLKADYARLKVLVRES
jgi:hypothetical protein